MRMLSLTEMAVFMMVVLGIAMVIPYDWTFIVRQYGTIVHETCHSLVLIATGGELLQYRINPMGGGNILGTSGSRFLSLMSGYTGTVVFGSTLLFCLLSYKQIRWIPISLCFWLVTWVVVAWPVGLDSYTMTLLLVFALSFFGLSLLQGEFQRLVLIALVITLLSTSIDNVVDDTLIRTNARSDAVLLAERFGGTGVLWGWVWLLSSYGCIGVALRYSWRNYDAVLMAHIEQYSNKEVEHNP